ncbi:unnamed protein product, partial [Echinostoma caproni]|uniref:Cytochrome P450 n=1 Tax=Echinostoma caproni TaxID=27848 RepID=A0A183AQ65_9TREM
MRPAVDRMQAMFDHEMIQKNDLMKFRRICCPREPIFAVGITAIRQHHGRISTTYGDDIRIPPVYRDPSAHTSDVYGYETLRSPQLP